MSVLVYIDTISGNISKNAMEAVFYGSKIGPVTVVTNGGVSADKLASLGNFGATKVLVQRALQSQDASQLTRLVSATAGTTGATTIVFSQDLTGRAVAPRVSASLKAGLVAGAVSLPDAGGIFKVNVFSGKAFGNVKVNSAIRVVNLTPNSIALETGSGSAAVEEISVDCGAPSYTVKSVEKQEGDILLPEAETVVSAGRGLKGPENWGMVEELAKTLRRCNGMFTPCC
jgi:electron transfer flavoprotein alpha subunit